MVNPTEVQSSLEGIDYPVDKKGLIKHAKEHGASSDVIGALKDLPDQEYGDVADVSSQLKKDDDEDEEDDDKDETADVESAEPLLDSDKVDDDMEE